jgi:GNAT superfamily N-acetyltransferase
MARLTFHEVDAGRWDDFVSLFESTGAPKYCWCMAWRARGKQATEMDNAARKAAMKSRVDAGEPIGILAYRGDEPVGWCSIAPRDTYRPLGGPDADDGEDIWSLVCFFIKRELRGQQLAPQLLKAAIAHARKQGATVLEAYPVDPDSPSYRFMGFVPMFEKARFVEIGTAGTRRHVMRLSL